MIKRPGTGGDACMTMQWKELGQSWKKINKYVYKIYKSERLKVYHPIVCCSKP